jgi:hypothetical protein
MIILIAYIILFSYLGFILFNDLAEINGSDLFETFLNSLYTVWVTLRTSNYPDVTLPEY